VQIAAIVLEYVKVLAWPIVVLVALLLFRKSVQHWVRRLTTFEAEGFGVKLRGTGHTPRAVATWLAARQKVSPNIRFALASADAVDAAPNRDDFVRAAIEVLAEDGVEDPNIRLFFGIFRDDVEMVSKALASGAEPDATDIETLRAHSQRLNTDAIQRRIYERSKELARRRRDSPHSAISESVEK